MGGTLSPCGGGAGDLGTATEMRLSSLVKVPLAAFKWPVDCRALAAGTRVCVWSRWMLRNGEILTVEASGGQHESESRPANT